MRRGCEVSPLSTPQGPLLPQRCIFAVLLGFMLALYGCAGDGPATDLPMGSAFVALQADVFALHCAVGPCHSAGVAAGGLVLEGPNAYDQLVGALPNNDVARAAGWLRVAPGDPQRSFLWIKLTGPGPGQGSRMPLGAAPLPPEELQRIEEWILMGAPRGDTPRNSDTPTPTPTPIPATPTHTTQVTFAVLQRDLFTPRCAVAFCHDTTTKAGNMDLTDAYASLVGVPAENVAVRAAGWLRVTPGQPEASFLLVKLTLAAFDARFGSPMPLSGSRIEPQWIDAVAAWIQRGAPRDEERLPYAAPRAHESGWQ